MRKGKGREDREKNGIRKGERGPREGKIDKRVW